jgi:hypothetical protein
MERQKRKQVQQIQIEHQIAAREGMISPRKRLGVSPNSRHNLEDREKLITMLQECSKNIE